MKQEHRASGHAAALHPADDWALLQQEPVLSTLIERRPADWAQVSAELAGVMARRDPQELRALVESSRQRAVAGEAFLSGERDGKAFADFVARETRKRMTELAVRQYAFSMATGVTSGKVRFGWWSGLIAQRLLFERALVRRAVPMATFKRVWPLVTQKRLLMPLVEKRGIWCFFSRELIAGLAQLIGTRRAHEIAAGDGALSRLLAEQGVNISASDDQSWNKLVSYPEHVENAEAVEALRRHRPQVVLCCWPPAGNRFERQVFRQPSVQTYIVIGSSSRFITGNWGDYLAEQQFTLTERADLGALVLPPELKAGVWVFERRQ
ncbi:hypothetical protein ACTSKR_13210 [Chitinibacteraceae bacterium HSL-7]